MAYSITLNETPNQTFSVTVGDYSYKITLRQFEGTYYADVYIDAEIVCYSAQCVPNAVLIPYEYMTQGGNFYWYCQDDEYPDYEKFNDTHLLYYFTDDEIEEYGL